MGSNTTPFPQTTTGGAGFAGGIQAVSGTAFPLVQDAVAIEPISLSILELDAVIGRGATLTARSNGYELAIPALGIDAVLPGDGSSVPVVGASSAIFNVSGSLSLGVSLHNYMAGGLWVYEAADPQADFSAVFAPFITGYPTPVKFMPVIGTGAYTATLGVDGIVFVRTASGASAATLMGDISLNANFSTGSITGAVSEVVASDSTTNNTSDWNAFSISASISGLNCTDRNCFSGTTATSSTPNTKFALNGSSVGRIIGYFFGPDLGSVGAVWSLGNSDNSGAAYGIIGSDRTGGTIPTVAGQYLSFLLPHIPWSSSGIPDIPSPLAATRDNVSTPSLFASPGGPSFDGSAAPLFPDPNSGALLMDKIFPIWISGLQFTSAAVLPFTNSTRANFSIGAISDHRLTLAIPALGISEVMTLGVNTPDPSSNVNAGNGAGFVNYGLSYTEFGAWSQTDPTGVQSSTGYFSYGFETPPVAMPATGTATYVQTGGVNGTVFVRSGNGVVEATVSGDASLTANFATGGVSGNFTNMSAYNSGRFTPWNDVSVTGTVAAGSNSFSGSTATASAPGGSFGLSGNASGHINGSFYGPAANEIGAVWTLSNGDGTGSAIGVAGARKQ